MTGSLTLADPAPPRRPRVPRLLRQAAFRRYWSAQTVSLFGDQITMLAVPLLAVLAFGAGPAEMGYLTAASLLPNLFFSLPAGAWVDRYPRRRQVMIVADVGRAVLLLAVPLLWWVDALNLPLLCVVAFLIGILSVFFEVAHSSLFAALVRRADYVDANSLVNGSRAMSHVAGPSIGGVLVQVLTAPFALLSGVLTYLISAVFLARTQVTENPVPKGSGRGMAAGVRYVARSAVLRATLLGTTTLNLFNYMFAALFVLYVTTELGVSPGLLGLIIGAGAVGGLLGAAVTGAISRRIGIGPAVLLGFVAFPAPMVLVPLAMGPQPLVLALLFAAEFVAALGVMILDIAVGSVQIAATPVAMLAVVSGFRRTVNYGIRPIGAVLGGTLGAAIGVRPALWIASLGALLGVLWVVFSPLRTMRTLPES
ncbi:MFS transporter [Verrucosispora sioxanthis]|uniref:MFS transporter n=1 Tax=Verrucosispora sioxanthis TaxID=2499994 RepID=A0A6M1L6S4_9ACTN|nr:MFS transporter [Verrucosispora sioxanthis]NEE62193.1 MFS transporter [Verrucosispora sioxanthis]NGM11303.1 MFS transporter [Verrucosispora sioxanthis]